jgi:hypothetical protein
MCGIHAFGTMKAVLRKVNDVSVMNPRSMTNLGARLGYNHVGTVIWRMRRATESNKKRRMM